MFSCVYCEAPIHGDNYEFVAGEPIHCACHEAQQNEMYLDNFDDLQSFDDEDCEAELFRVLDTERRFDNSEFYGYDFDAACDEARHAESFERDM